MWEPPYKTWSTHDNPGLAFEETTIRKSSATKLEKSRQKLRQYNCPSTVTESPNNYKPAPWVSNPDITGRAVTRVLLHTGTPDQALKL
jgi:hypothetical protein